MTSDYGILPLHHYTSKHDGLAVVSPDGGQPYLVHSRRTRVPQALCDTSRVPQADQCGCV